VSELDEPNLFEYLTSVATVAAFVEDRVYPLILPQHDFAGARAMPAIVYTRVSDARQAVHCDPPQDVTLAAQYQIDVYATKYETAVRVAHAVRLALIGKSAMMGAVRVINAFLDSSEDFLDPDPGLFRRFMQFTLWYRESTAIEDALATEEGQFLETEDGQILDMG
jgi:hypothetical protein